MRRIEVTYSTMGQSSLASAREGGGYRYQRDPDWTPNDPRYRRDRPARLTAGSEERTARRERRIDEFAAALAGLGEPDPWKAANPAVIAAGVIVGVGEKTAKSYRTALRKRNPRDGEVPGD